MTDAPNRLPLWEVMHEARVLGEADRFTKAAEIRALRDWLVPEEPEPSFYADGYVPMRLGEERQRLRALLTAEANRAESGDHG